MDDVRTNIHLKGIFAFITFLLLLGIALVFTPQFPGIPNLTILGWVLIGFALILIVVVIMRLLFGW